jgi:c-di-GMP-binding flagellar brake protein YcgR
VATFESEKRDFIRIKVSVPVKYKLVSDEINDPDLDEIHDGSTANLSGGGLLLSGKIPDLDWLAAMLTGKMTVGVSMQLPTSEEPVRALTRVAWIEGIDESAQTADLGLRFVEITQESQDAILAFVIKTKMPD